MRITLTPTVALYIWELHGPAVDAAMNASAYGPTAPIHGSTASFWPMHLDLDFDRAKADQLFIPVAQAAQCAAYMEYLEGNERDMVAAKILQDCAVRALKKHEKRGPVLATKQLRRIIRQLGLYLDGSLVESLARLADEEPRGEPNKLAQLVTT